ncbi:hypothetical protein CVIRNUC_002436 [Coccomyxa viridis]|uniref:Uncharacterized protein n=1 Tax=Coccomyxa viridis TaxID=1274662 RepID=A0AAV1HVQ5_9CHLO|nr:hypothetical protein CVIRNUC_002436 [Coccomyxa viridis]
MQVTGDSLDFPIPVQMCLPITELQRRAEELEFSELLDQAAQRPKGSMERLLLVAAFAQSAFHAVGKLKPMVPVMGETYELVLPEKRLRLLVEMTYLSLQEERGIVSWVAEGEQWRLEGEDEPKLRFRATSVEMCLNWLDTLTFSDGDVYTWEKLTTGCASVSFLNGMAPAFHGTILVQNPGHKQSVTLEFQKRSTWQVLTSNRGVKDGVRFYLLDVPFLSGSWRSKLVAHMPNGSQWTVFEVNPLPSGPNRLGLNVRSMQLNEMTAGLEARLPPTDTRWRRDLRALEMGAYAEAGRRPHGQHSRHSHPQHMLRMCRCHPVNAAKSLSLSRL